jgi:archaellum component FlaC
MNPRTALFIGGAGLVVGIVALVIGISAKNGNRSDEEIAAAAKTELERQVGGAAALAGNAKAEDVRQSRQIRAIRTRQSDLVTEVAKLRTDVTEQGKSNSKLDGELTQLSKQLDQLRRTVEKLQKQVNNKP